MSRTEEKWLTLDEAKPAFNREGISSKEVDVIPEYMVYKGRMGYDLGVIDQDAFGFKTVQTVTYPDPFTLQVTRRMLINSEGINFLVRRIKANMEEFKYIYTHAADLSDGGIKRLEQLKEFARKMDDSQWR